MENKIILREDIVYVSPTKEGERFLKERDLLIKDYVIYDIVYNQDSQLKGVLVQGLPGGTLESLKYVKIYFGCTSEGKQVTPFGVACFEKGEK